MKPCRPKQEQGTGSVGGFARLNVFSTLSRRRSLSRWRNSGRSRRLAGSPTRNTAWSAPGAASRRHAAEGAEILEEVTRWREHHGGVLVAQTVAIGLERPVERVEIGIPTGRLGDDPESLIVALAAQNL